MLTSGMFHETVMLLGPDTTSRDTSGALAPVYVVGMEIIMT